MSMGDFWDEVRYTLDGAVEILQDVFYIVKNLPSIVSRQRKIKKLCRYFDENLPEQFTKSPQYKVNIIWDAEMFLGSITLDGAEEGVDYSQMNDEEKRAQAKRIVAEFLPGVSNPPFPIHAIFAIQYPDGKGYSQYIVDGGKLLHTKIE